jgi:hypothetical protein
MEMIFIVRGSATNTFYGLLPKVQLSSKTPPHPLLTTKTSPLICTFFRLFAEPLELLEKIALYFLRNT